jgi:quercetin dioxygenase-like cupin family protein
MLLVKELPKAGELRGVIYDFEAAGDVLAKHVHTEDTNHITVVARGKIKVGSHDWELEAVAGQVLIFRPNEPHEFTALEDNTRIVNIVTKYGGEVNDLQLAGATYAPQN